MKAIAFTIMGVALFAIVAGAAPSKPAEHHTYKLINFVKNYPHKQADFLANDKDGCPVFSVDDGSRVLKVCIYGQALFAVEKR